jgi:hypothetical protein
MPYQEQEQEQKNTLLSNALHCDGTGALPLNPKAEEDKAIGEIFAYYLQATDRNPKTYSLTLNRKKKGIARLRKCLKRTNGNPEKAIGLMKLAVDRLAASDWHMGRDGKTGGKRYCEWENHLFDSYERMEKWWNQ